MISFCTARPTPPASGIPSSIRLRCRDFNFVTFNFPDDKAARDAFEFIRSRTCRLGSIEKLYAFTYAAPRQERACNGWDIYDAKAEFRRQGISEKATEKGWRSTDINKTYAFSPTYPAYLVVPSTVSDNVLKYAANFRSRARIPTLTYLHPINNCTITRSSQPYVGLTGKRSLQDERLVGACFSASTDFADHESSPPHSQADVAAEHVEQEITDTERLEDDFIASTTVMYDEKTGKRLIYGAQQHNLIVDARPAINSYAMQAVGLGSENMDYYKFAKKVFLSIDNIHVMRESLNKVIDAIKDADVSPFPPNRELLAKSGWLKHITSILDGCAIIARQVSIQHSHALIHCSDGWDRTSQLCAISQLMLDPYYRTIDGFIVLIEKDWLSFGHMFQQRGGYLNSEKWFTIQNDALAGATVQPGESDGRSDAIENALASAKRFFNKTAGHDRDDGNVDKGATADEAKRLASPGPDGSVTKLKDVSPVFHQFLDATYQLLRQHPTRFEFNERFLRRLLYHVYSCQYGTFLYDNERQRQEAKLRERTASVWDYFLSRRREFTSPEYNSVVDDNIRGQERLLFPKLGEVRWWHQVFNRSDDEMNGALNAVAAQAEKVAAYRTASPPELGSEHFSGASRPGSLPGTPPKSPKPPGLPTSKSTLAGVESAAHKVLTPEEDSVPTLRRSSSTGEMQAQGAFASLRDGISDLRIGKSVLASVSRWGNGEGKADGRQQAVEQEMTSMSEV
jgi:myotubularin-related protein 6/7/8